MIKENADFKQKLPKIGRTYSDKIKKRVVQEINAGLLTHRAAAKKYFINRKTVDSWVTSEAYNNLRPLEIAVGIMEGTTADTTCRKLAKQVMDLTKELEKAKLKISGLETMIEVSEQDLNIKIRKKHGAKQSKD